MYTQSKLFLIHCESPLLAGAGKGEGYIDKPVQRDITTGFPKIEASSLRGSIRDLARDLAEQNSTQVTNALLSSEERESKLNLAEQNSTQLTNNWITRTFGNHDNGDKHSAIGFSDAMILAFPVRSVYGSFVWVTCPYVLYEFVRTLKKLPDYENCTIKHLPISINNADAIIFDNSVATPSGKILAEEIVFNKRECTDRPTINVFNETKALPQFLADLLYKAPEEEYWHEMMCKKLIIVSDLRFGYIVKQYTDKQTRNRIDPKTGVAASTGLFVEENVPRDTIFYSVFGTTKEFITYGSATNPETPLLSAEEIMEGLSEVVKDKIFQCGADKAINKGALRAIPLERTQFGHIINEVAV